MREYIIYIESEEKKMKAWWIMVIIGIAILVACELAGIPID